MTYIIGIQARDKDSGISYAAIAADTQWRRPEVTKHFTIPQTAIINRDDARRIVIPQDSNYIFAFDGQPLNAAYFALRNSQQADIDKFIDEYPARLHRLFMLATTYNMLAKYEPVTSEQGVDALPEKELFQQLKDGKCAPVIDVNIHTDNHANSFLFAINNGTEREMYTVFPNGKSLRRGFTSFGSASPVALEFLVSNLGGDPSVEPQLSPSDAVGILTEAMQRAQPGYNAGGVDLAVLTSKGADSFRDELDKLKVAHQKDVSRLLDEHSQQIQL